MDTTYLSKNITHSFRTQNVLGEKGRRIRELTAVVQKRFGFPEGSVEVRPVFHKFLCEFLCWFVAILQNCTVLQVHILNCYLCYSSMLRRLPPGVCVPLLRQNLCATSCSAVWLSVGKSYMLIIIYFNI